MTVNMRRWPLAQLEKELAFAESAATPNDPDTQQWYQAVLAEYERRQQDGYTLPCSVCGTVPDAEADDPPNHSTIEGQVTLCASCINQAHDALQQWYDDHPTPRALYGPSITYRERC